MAVERLTDYTRRIWTGLATDASDPDMQVGDVIYYMDTSTCSIITGIPAPGSIDTKDLPDIGGGGGGSEVPSDYTQFEYIAGDGSAWIDTGENRQAGDVLEMYGGLLLNGTGNSGFWHPFGVANCFIQVSRYYIPNTSATVRINSGGNKTSQPFNTYLCHTTMTDTELIQRSIEGTPGSVITTSSGTVDTSSYTLALLARKTAENTVDYPANGYAIFRFTWYRNGNVIHDYIPAMRNLDSVLGLYDKVAGTFLTNAGSGNFRGGTRE